MKAVIVEWDDSSSYSPWHNDSDLDIPAKCFSVGVICKDEDRYISVAQSKSSEGNYGDVITIPRGCIKRVRQLRIKG